MSLKRVSLRELLHKRNLHNAIHPFWYNDGTRCGDHLFWDEPENSLNPELVPVLVEILLELSRGGAQIFLAPHSELLASYFTVNRQKDDKVKFYSWIEGR
ncbi:MAG: ATP-binding protein [Candidatus Adiutrix sp.]|jgi:predicted ATPase|nr:ATP-binding protein [Candidatus Adiutrix sp.]